MQLINRMKKIVHEQDRSQFGKIQMILNMDDCQDNEQLSETCSVDVLQVVPNHFLIVLMSFRTLIFVVLAYLVKTTPWISIGLRGKIRYFSICCTITQIPSMILEQDYNQFKWSRIHIFIKF